jgi:hypothetical protein
MGETTFAQSYLSKNSLITITFDELEAMARVIGYSFKDLEFVLDYKKAAGIASRMGCKSIYDYHSRWDQSLHLPYFPDIFYAGRGWPVGVSEEEAWKDFICAHSVDYLADLSLNSVSANWQKTVLHESNRADSIPEQDVSDITMPPRRVQKIHKPKKAAKDYYDYATAKRVAIKLGFRSIQSYQAGKGIDPRLPNNPIYIYGEKFEGWVIFLGLCSMHEAMEIIRRENCNFTPKYFALTKHIRELPLHPSIYGKKWRSLSNFIRAAHLHED